MNQTNSLTRYPPGSVRELWSISMPLMISTLASLFMIFTDRIFLAHYSIAALNASVTAGTLAWALMIGVGMITAMSEIFVAQYNGAKQYHRLGVPVWQMIWFSFFSLAFFIPVAIWGAPLFFKGSIYAEMEIEFFRWLMFFGPSYALMTTFSGFFIGRGKTKMLVWLAVGANMINIALDRALIFGIPGIVPEMGIKGAAIATCFGYMFEASMLAALFLRKENRLHYGASSYKINWEEMKKCCKVGFPQGIFCSLEVFGWAVFYWLMTELSETHITISSICQSFTILLSFFCDGLSRGAAAVAGNLIGAKQRQLVSKVLKSGVFLLVIFNLIVGIFLVVDPDDTVRLLFLEQGTTGPVDIVFQGSLKICLIYAFLYLFFEGMRWLLSGLLIAAGDTMFLLIAGSLSVWFCLLLPIYWIVVKGNLSVDYAWGMTVVYSALLLLAYWVRFKYGAWQKIDLIDGVNKEENSLAGTPAVSAPDLLE
ncbi:MAG: MATE family efflux transporter [Verrucomicrobia bacterium]|nr:MATE family efflux transporter [Verrucomicrobiota bacterium]